MGHHPSADLMYGYDLGGGHSSWKVREYDVDTYRLKLPWLTEDEDGEIDFGDCLDKALLRAHGVPEEVIDPWKHTWYDDDLRREQYAAQRRAWEEIGVGRACYGHENQENALIARGSQITADDDGPTVVGPGLFDSLLMERWDARLRWALHLLGMTPDQDGPQWLLCASYG